MVFVKLLTLGCPNLVKYILDLSLIASHGYILRAHMNKRTLLNDVVLFARIIDA